MKVIIYDIKKLKPKNLKKKKGKKGNYKINQVEVE